MGWFENGSLWELARRPDTAVSRSKHGTL